jgi:hypothetical protein
VVETDTGLTGHRQAGSAAYVPLWGAVNDLAQAWAHLPFVQNFAAALPRNAPQRSVGIPGRLQEMEAGGGDISEHPLRLTATIQFMLRMSFLEAQPPPQRWDSWFETARQIEAAHRLTVAWLRSRMPGYPSLPAPHLAPGTPLTTDEFTKQLIWTRGERTQGLQFQNPPAQIGQILQATPAQQLELVDATRALVLAFERTDEWTRLAAMRAALTDSARADLRQARETLTQQLSRDKVDAHSQLALARYNYRVTVLSDVLSRLSGSAREYVTAFTAANKLVEVAGSDVFGELTAYGQPTTLSRPRDIDLRPGTFQLVSFARMGGQNNVPGPLEIGQILWLGDTLVPDAVRLTGTTSTFMFNDATERWTGLVLAGTSNAWSSLTRS